MARPIDADELVNKIMEGVWLQYYNSAGDAIGRKRMGTEFIDVINNEPTVDAVPVKHGHWETWGFRFHGIDWKRCSECGKPADVSYCGILEGRIEMATSSMCSCCGALMIKDGEQNADNQ